MWLLRVVKTAMTTLLAASLISTSRATTMKGVMTMMMPATAAALAEGAKRGPINRTGTSTKPRPNARKMTCTDASPTVVRYIPRGKTIAGEAACPTGRARRTGAAVATTRAVQHAVEAEAGATVESDERGAAAAPKGGPEMEIARGTKSRGGAGDTEKIRGTAVAPTRVASTDLGVGLHLIDEVMIDVLKTHGGIQQWRTAAGVAAVRPLGTAVVAVATKTVTVVVADFPRSTGGVPKPPETRTAGGRAVKDGLVPEWLRAGSGRRNRGTIGVAVAVVVVVQAPKTAAAWSTSTGIGREGVGVQRGWRAGTAAEATNDLGDVSFVGRRV